MTHFLHCLKDSWKPFLNTSVSDVIPFVVTSMELRNHPFGLDGDKSMEYSVLQNRQIVICEVCFNHKWPMCRCVVLKKPTVLWHSLDVSFSLHLCTNGGIRHTFLCVQHTLLEYIVDGTMSIACRAGHHWHLRGDVYATRRLAFSSLPSYRALLQAFVMSLNEICLAKTKCYLHNVLLVPFSNVANQQYVEPNSQHLVTTLHKI